MWDCLYNLLEIQIFLGLKQAAHFELTLTTNTIFRLRCTLNTLVRVRLRKYLLLTLREYRLQSTPILGGILMHSTGIFKH